MHAIQIGAPAEISSQIGSIRCKQPQPQLALESVAALFLVLHGFEEANRCRILTLSTRIAVNKNSTLTAYRGATDNERSAIDYAKPRRLSALHWNYNVFATIHCI